MANDRPRKTVVCLQSSYIPWKGYFDLIARCDEFILLDNTQFTRRDWRSRNQIKTANGLRWLTIPVESKGKFEQPINQVRVADPTWANQHWQTIRHAYAKAPYFAAHQAWIKALYERAAGEPMLSLINHMFLVEICTFLNIKTSITWSDKYPTENRKTARLIDICWRAKGTDYLTGPAAKAYIQPEMFDAAEIKLHYMDYRGYPEYAQLHGPFVHQVSIIDAIFNLGEHARTALERPHVVTAELESSAP